MPRPAKPIDTAKGHRTKAEIKSRKQAEKDIETGNKIIEKPETKANTVAHKEFLRIAKLFKAINKDDELYASVINRYCQLYAECLEFENMKLQFENVVEDFKQDKKLVCNEFQTEEDLENGKGGMSLSTFYKMLDRFSRYIFNLDACIMSKRKMMFDIEKENIMTVQAALRSIPKEPQNTQSAAEIIAEALRDDNES